MRIKRLEVLGFKSFKDKTVINFDDGITGIVGPNGCGKSNIVDAFFWALGEQNPRNLRGQNMSDLIFGGSAKAPPGNMAEVTLLLEVAAELSGPNAPSGATAEEKPTYTREVAITRRLYKSGESEYFLNKTPCRLRDIQELFMDTGAGARGHSIIQQGQIQKIVQAKPEERRTMIEEVAGVVKYKARRRESARKLDSTRQNLERVTDVLNEIERQKKQMERQANKARRYKEWKEELQTIDLRFSAFQWEKLAEHMAGFEQRLEQLEADSLSFSTQRETEETVMSQMRLEATQAAKITEEFQNNWMKNGQELNNTESNLQFQEKMLEELRSSSEQIDSEASTEQAKIADLQSDYETAEKEASGINEKHAKAVEARESAEAAAESTKNSLMELERESEESKQSLIQIASQIAEAEFKVSSNEARLQDIEAHIQQSESEHKNKQAELESFANDFETKSLELETSQTEMEQLEQKSKELIEKNNSLQSELDANRKQYSEAESQKARLSAKLETLEGQKARHEGCKEGVQKTFQEILPEKAHLGAQIKGTLADVIAVDPGKSAAVESALKVYLEAILSQDTNSINEILTELTEKHESKAAFIDLSKIKDLNSSTIENFEAKELQEHIHGPLTNFVKVKEEHASETAIQQLVAFLLEKAILVDSLSVAQKLATTYPQYNFISESGEICRAAWFIEGGKKDNSSILKRDQEIQELQIQIQELNTNIDRYSEAIQNNESALEQLRADQMSLEEKSSLAAKQLSELRTQVATLEFQKNEAQKSIQSKTEELEKLQKEQEEKSAELVGIQEKRKLLTEERNSLQEKNETMSKKLPALKEESEALQQKLTEAKIHEASVLEQKNTVQTKYELAKENLERVSRHVENLLQQAMQKKEAAEKAIAEIEELQTKINTLKSTLVESEEKFRQAREKLDKLNDELESHRKASQQASNSERKVQDEINQQKLKQERHILERENLAQNVLERYGLEIAEYVTTPEVLEEVELLKNASAEEQQEISNNILRLKEKIRKLGEVNTAAIEEFDALNDRYQFLSTQKEDLERSMNDLEETINKINKISKERFMRAFEQVNSQFVRVFPALFGGGQAQLMMTSPEEFMETGVDIMAQPPGKKLQNINLLSGGEKTLTAISLLFAIFLVKPSPFCLLDEVDAPLDDANIGRFNAILREMARKSQFIIITHNKRTMELNDKLYGVTMEDAGISKMVSIRLTEEQATI